MGLIAKVGRNLEDPNGTPPRWPPMIACPAENDLDDSYALAVVRGCLFRIDRFTPFRVARMPTWLASGLRADGFVRDTLGDADRFANRFELLRSSLHRAPPHGLVLEFGVYKGDSISFIARCAETREDRTVYGFDSFGGLPEDWSPGYGRGAFRLDGEPVVPENVTLVRGLFQATLGPFLEKRGEPVAFVHIDSDLYSSAKFVLEMLHRHRRLGDGTVVVFDELVGAPNWWREGEFLALREFLRTNAFTATFTGHAVASGSVAIRLQTVSPHPVGAPEKRR